MIRSLLYPDSGLEPRWIPGLDGAIPPHIQDVLPADSSGPRIARAIGALLAQVVLSRQLRNVLELGAGASSVVFAHALRGGRLTSVEQWPAWCRDQWDQVLQTGIDAELIQARPTFGLNPFPCHRYAGALDAVRRRGPYDLVFVDAPQWFYGRDGALPLVVDSLRPGALIVLDDAGRSQEQWAIRRWLRAYPGVELVAYDSRFGRNGVAVLRYNGDATCHGAGVWGSAMFHAGVGWVVRHTRGSPSPFIASSRHAGLAPNDRHRSPGDARPKSFYRRLGDEYLATEGS